MAVKTTTRRDAYAEVTDRIIAALDRGVAPWRKGYDASVGRERNAVSNRPYSGVNVLLLTLTRMERGYSDPRWLTFRQAQAAGGNVRKGEKGTTVVYWNRIKTEDKDTKEIRWIPLLKVFTVFNVAQIDGVEFPAPEGVGDVDPVEAADAIVEAYVSRTTVRIWHEAVDVPYFHPSTDVIHLPAREAYESAERYYETVMHEVTHSTGVASRLNRPSLAEYHQHTERSREELIAEIGAAFLMAEAGLASDESIENMAAYCGSWARFLRDDKRAIVVAAGAAARAAAFVLGETEGEDDAE